MSELFATHAARVRARFAASLACDESAFSSERLTIVDRLDSAPWPYVAHAVTFGTGTVLSIDPGYREFATAQVPERHYQAMHPQFFAGIADEARRRGATLTASAPELVFTLARTPDLPEAPAGFELRTMDRDWMNAEQASGRFERGVGEPNQANRAARNQYALAVSEGSELVAVAGVFLTLGNHEIGVEVVRSQRGQGLGLLVVAAAAREIVKRGETPVYFCEPTNIRSQRTALSAGFLPVCSIASVA